MKSEKCKCVKGIDGFTWGEVYDVEFAGRVWWAVNDNGKRISGASESFEPIKEPASEDLEAEIEDYMNRNFSEGSDGCLISDKNKVLGGVTYLDITYIARHFANWQKQQMMKDAIPANILTNQYGNKYIQSWSGLKQYDKYKNGDEVKLIIIKKE